MTQTIPDRRVKKTKCLPTFFKQTETELVSETRRLIFEVLNTKKWTKTLANNQHDAQLLYFIIHLLQSSTCFEVSRVHHQEVKLY